MQIIFRQLRNCFSLQHDTAIFYGFSMLFGMLGALIISMITHLYVDETPRIGTVNITGLVDRFIKQEANKNLSPDALKKEVKQYGVNLNKELQLLAKEKHITLLPSEAVIAGNQDYTLYIKQRMLDKDDSKNE